MSSERFDVAVIGARTPGAGAKAQLAAVLAHRHALPPAAVTLGLDHGGVEVHRGLTREQAEIAARELFNAGAVIEIRPARDVSGVLALEPDSSDAILLVGVPSDSGDDMLPPAPPFGVVPPSPGRATGPQPVPYPSPSPGSQMAGPAPVVVPSAPGFDAALVEPRVEPRIEPRIEPSGTRHPTGTHAAVEASRRATGSQPAVEASRRATGSQPAVEASRRPTGSHQVAPEPAASTSGADRRFARAVADDKLELDLAAAGLRASPVGTTALSRGQRAPGAPPPPEPVPVAAPAPSFVAPPSQDGLIVPDRIASALIGAAIGAALGLFVALGWVRGDANALTVKLEAELQSAVADPIAVEEGRARQPEAIATELREGLDGTRSSFLLVWAIVTVPLAAVGAIPRPRQ